MNENKDPPKKTLPGSKRRPPASLFLWLLAFLVLASLIVLAILGLFVKSFMDSQNANAFIPAQDVVTRIV